MSVVLVSDRALFPGLTGRGSIVSSCRTQCRFLGDDVRLVVSDTALDVSAASAFKAVSDTIQGSYAVDRTSAVSDTERAVSDTQEP
jgi:hypothetical protein